MPSMPAIKPTCVRDLKLRVNIVDVVSRVAAVRKAGSRFKGLCPFHSEKTPSFHVDPAKGFYKCFGCGKAGDIITFVRETEQLSFTEAVEALGQRFNIPIEYEEGGGPTREQRSLRQEIFDIHEQAAAHFHEVFRGPGPTGDFMRSYWTAQRRFPTELADEFKIGAAEPDDTGLAARLLRLRYSEAALRQCGLFFIREGSAPSPGTLRPRFRGRLVIPIRDHQGRIVAFTARQTSLCPQDDPAREAKYVNSPETPIFTKGNLLFNLDRARTGVGDDRPFVMVEGQLDALRCWPVGLKTAVAPQGTAITEASWRSSDATTPRWSASSTATRPARRRRCGCCHGAQGGHRGALPHARPGDAEGRPRPAVPRAGASRPTPRCARRSLSAMAFACRALLPSPATASSEPGPAPRRASWGSSPPPRARCRARRSSRRRRRSCGCRPRRCRATCAGSSARSGPGPRAAGPQGPGRGHARARPPAPVPAFRADRPAPQLGGSPRLDRPAPAGRGPPQPVSRGA